MRPLLLRSLYWLAGVGAAAALAALLFGWAVGLALALLAALIGLGFHLYYLDKLLAWLDNPAPERTPEGMGGWQDVFSALYRQSRQQTMAQKKLSSALERFINAGEAMPDGVVVLDEHDRIEWLNPMAVDHFQLDRKRDVGNMVANLVRQPGFHDYLLAQNYSQPLILRLSQPVEQVLAVQLVPFDSTRKLLISRSGQGRVNNGGFFLQVTPYLYIEHKIIIDNTLTT
jgi:two-component system phosphate regulon sensor histidine kinase PhoR